MRVKPVRLDMKYSSDEGTLLCPYCEQDNAAFLHHLGLSYFARGEDEVTGTRIDVKQGGVRVNVSTLNPLEGNPSARRGGISILFWCEICTGVMSFVSRNIRGTRWCFGGLRRNWRRRRGNPTLDCLALKITDQCEPPGQPAVRVYPQEARPM